MTLSKYQPIDAGLRELGRSHQLQADAVAAASKVAGAANSVDPDGRYRAGPATVPSGWQNEDRAGAEIEQTRYSPRAGRSRILRNATRGS